jgi:membrane-bound lytic murein transglycosylase D
MRRTLGAGLCLAVAACGANPRPQVQTAAPAPVVAVAPQPPPPPKVLVDPVAALISNSQNHFETGERELKAGHLQQARHEFDSAVEVLLSSPYGARSDARMREHFDRLVDRIHAYEVTALAQGDGFAETRYEPAAIDELLKNATTFPAPSPDAATQAAVQADLAQNPHDIPIPDSPKILSYVELFQGRLRDYIQESLARGARYLPMIQDVFRAEGLPLDLAYIPIIESSFKTNALSKAHAKGPWQFMKPTAKEHGLHADWFIDERSDPEKATVAAAEYLKTLSKMFDGDWNLVLAAYNGGPGRVSRAIKRAGGVDDFWRLSASSKYLPRETREYVPMILAAIIIGRNPAQYGFELVTGEPLAYEKVAMPQAIDLRRVAEWAGTTVDEIQALNPELRRWTTPVKYPNYEVKVPKGSADRLSAKLAEASPADFVSLKWYTAKKGETLLSVAHRFGVSRADVAEANNLSVKSRLRPGQSLIIPRAPSTILAARSERSAPTAVASRGIVETTDSPVATAPQRLTRITYRVKKGDTLSSIAETFDTTVAKIKSWNHLSGTRIAPGARLKIMSAVRTRAAAAPAISLLQRNP